MRNGNDNVPRQVRHLAAHVRLAAMAIAQGAAQGQCRAVNRRDQTFLGAHRLGPAATLAKGGARFWPAQFAGRDDDPVADAPVGRWFVQRHPHIACLGRRCELQPRAAQRRAMHVPAAAARHNGGQSFLVRARKVPQSNRGCYACRNR